MSDYTGSRGTIAEAQKRIAQNLLDLGDLDLALKADQLAIEIEKRFHQEEEPTRDFPLPKKEKDK